MSFHEARFPAALSVGSSGGPERRTEIVTLSNGFEERNAPWAQSRRRYDAGLGVRSLDDLAEVVAFFEARHGQLHAFRWKDWTDFKSCLPSAQPGATDRARDRERSNDAVRPAQGLCLGRPDLPPRDRQAGRRQRGGGGERGGLAAGTDFGVDHETGQVQLTAAPAAGAVVTAGFEFDVPVRFDTDRITTSLAGFAAGEIPSIPVVEVRL